MAPSSEHPPRPRRELRSVAVFCASSAGRGDDGVNLARAAGAALARRGMTVVYGGGSVGLMGAVADGALGAGGRVVGVIPRAMVEAERAHRGLSELHVVETMHQRKAMMADLSDAFVALPGGFGTFDELFEIITWGQLGMHGKPVGVLDAGGFYAPLLTFLDGVVAAGFIQPRFRAMLLAGAELESLLDRMAAHEPPAGTGFARPVDR